MFWQPLAAFVSEPSLMKAAERLNFVTFLASVYKSQSCQNYLATQDCSNGSPALMCMYVAPTLNCNAPTSVYPSQSQQTPNHHDPTLH